MLHLKDDNDTHKHKWRRLHFAEHIWISLRINIPNVTWAGNDLFTGSVVTPAKRQGGLDVAGGWGSTRYDESKEFLCSLDLTV